MYPESFDYVAAASVDEALGLYADHAGQEVTFVAGGHSLLPTMKTGLASPDVLIDVADVEGLHSVERGDGATTVGAMTTYATLAEDEGLAAAATAVTEAAGEVGDVQVRNVGTVGGNLAHADPASDLPAAMLAADATLHARGPDGERTVPIDDFFVAMFTTALADDELLTAVEVSHWADGSAYVKKPSPASGYAMVGVAAALSTDGDAVTDARVAANGAFDYARRLEGVEEALTGATVADDLAAEAAGRATEGVSTAELVSDTQASGEFRGHLLEVYAERAVDAALDRA